MGSTQSLYSTVLSPAPRCRVAARAHKELRLCRLAGAPHAQQEGWGPTQGSRQQETEASCADQPSRLTARECTAEAAGDATFDARDTLPVLDSGSDAGDAARATEKG